MQLEVAKSLVGLDVNATRVLAVNGEGDGPRHSVQLEDDCLELPTVISLESRQPEVGRPGQCLLRRKPHLVCHNFLSSLGGARQWSAGRHRLSASAALSLIFQYLQPLWDKAAAVGLALPSYLEADQALHIPPLGVPFRMPLVGMVPAALPLAMAAHAHQPWTGPGLVLEVDDHALTWTAIAAEHGELRSLGTHSLPHLRLPAWKEKLLNSVADQCIRQNRRDPRAYPDVEQTLFEQIGRVLSTTQQGQILELVIQRDQWYHNLLLRFEDVAQVCVPLVQQAMQALDELTAGLDPPGMPIAVVASWQAAQLPGLISAVEIHREQALTARLAADPREEDDPEPSGVCVMPASTVAHAVQALTGGWLQAGAPLRLVDGVPLPLPHQADSGQPRLDFRGREFLLSGTSFVVGRHPDCDLILDRGLYPTVSSQHCEIVCDRWSYMVRDLSKTGVLVNSRPVIREYALSPGDWIQLGRQGPRLRFLGQVAQPKKLMTIA